MQNIDVSHPYYALAKVLNDAFIQASAGKGSERHAYSVVEKYEDQLICEMDKRLGGHAAGPRYQAVKKIYESARMNPDAAIRELLGAINYIAAAIIILNDEKKVEHTNVEPAAENVSSNVQLNAFQTDNSDDVYYLTGERPLVIHDKKAQ